MKDQPRSHVHGLLAGLIALVIFASVAVAITARSTAPPPVPAPAVAAATPQATPAEAEVPSSTPVLTQDAARGRFGPDGGVDRLGPPGDGGPGGFDGRDAVPLAPVPGFDGR